MDKNTALYTPLVIEYWKAYNKNINECKTQEEFNYKTLKDRKELIAKFSTKNEESKNGRNDINS